MPSCKILDIAEFLINHYNSRVRIQDIGIRPGEKLHEVLVTRYESPYTYKYGNDYYVIDRERNDYLEKVDFEEYTSNFQQLMDKVAIKQILERSGILL